MVGCAVYLCVGGLCLCVLRDMHMAAAKKERDKAEDLHCIPYVCLLFNCVNKDPLHVLKERFAQKIAQSG